MDNLATTIWFRACLILTSGIVLFLLFNEPTILIEEPILALIISFLCFVLVTVAASPGLFVLWLLLPAIGNSQICKTAAITRATVASLVAAIIVTAILLAVLIKEIETPGFEELLAVFAAGVSAALLSILSLHKSFNQFNTSNN